jgi:hypothetical protein
VVIDKGLKVATFSIQTQAVASNQNIAIVATAGGIPVTAALQLTP